MKKPKSLLLLIFCFSLSIVRESDAASTEQDSAKGLQSACEFFKSNFEKSFDTCSTRDLIREKVSKLKNLDCKDYGAALVEDIDFLATTSPYNFDTTCFQGGKFQNTALEKSVLVNTFNLDPKSFSTLMASTPSSRTNFVKLDRSMIEDHIFDIATLFPDKSVEKKILLTESFYQLQGRNHKATDSPESSNKKLDYIADHGGPKRSEWRAETEACYFFKPKLLTLFGNCALNPPFKKSFLALGSADCKSFPKLFMTELKRLSDLPTENKDKACVDF